MTSENVIAVAHEEMASRRTEAAARQMRIDAEREAQQAMHDRSVEASKAASHRRVHEAAEAFEVSVDAAQRAERALGIAVEDVAAFRRDNAARADIAHERLDQVLARVPAAAEAAADRLRQRLSDPAKPVEVVDLVRLAEMLTLRDRAEHAGAALHALLEADTRSFSPLSADEFAQRLAAAKTHRRTCEAAAGAARGAAQRCAEARRAVEDGDPHVDSTAATAAAVAAFEANDNAQAALRALRAALEGEE
jgi:hypothetical protein